jgi:cyclophilin family peptidyl-prolyl cis-trans isomerase
VPIFRPILFAACLISTAALAEETPAPATPPPAAAAMPASPSIAATSGPRVMMQTSMGDITLQLDDVHAPVTVRNFLRYVRERHFDGTVIYRVAKGFVIQMGSFDAESHGRPIHDGIPLEANNSLKNLRGTVAMARGDDPGSATAEFFINLVDNAALDHKPDDTADRTGYAVFGQVAEGMDVIDKIAQVPVGDHGPMPGVAPVDPITITSVSILP